MPAAPIKMCLDVCPPTKHAAKLASLAVKENPDNRLNVVGVAQPAQMALVTAKQWDVGRVIGVTFLDGTNSQQKLVVRTAVEWSSYANIKFDFDCRPGDAVVRISFKLKGAWSYIGTDALGVPKGDPTMNFGFQDTGTILHEFGHVLGCIHEHQHPDGGIPWDKDKVYSFYAGPPNRWTRDMVDVNLFQTYDKDQTNFSAYDRTSIMHYPIDPKLLTDPAKAVGWNRILSASDKQYIASVYPGIVNPAHADAPDDDRAKSITIPLSGTYRVETRGGRVAIVFN